MNPDENQPQAEQPNVNPTPSNDMNDQAPAPAPADPPSEPAPTVVSAPPATPTEPVAAPTPQAKSSKKGLIIAGVILVIVGAVVGAVLYFTSL